MRQSNGEGKLKQALDNLRLGVCDGDTETYLRSLSRSLPTDEMSFPVHIFLKKLPAEVHNIYMLHNLPGKILEYGSTDMGQTGLLKNNAAPETLMLKASCNVMLIYNYTKTLTNRPLGTFRDAETPDG